MGCCCSKCSNDDSKEIQTYPDAVVKWAKQDEQAKTTILTDELSGQKNQNTAAGSGHQEEHAKTAQKRAMREQRERHAQPDYYQKQPVLRGYCVDETEEQPPGEQHGQKTTRKEEQLQHVSLDNECPQTEPQANDVEEHGEQTKGEEKNRELDKEGSHPLPIDRSSHEETIVEEGGEKKGEGGEDNEYERIPQSHHLPERPEHQGYSLGDEEQNREQHQHMHMLRDNERPRMELWFQQANRDEEEHGQTEGEEREANHEEEEHGAIAKSEERDHEESNQTDPQPTQEPMSLPIVPPLFQGPLDIIMESAFKCLQVIQPWHLASSDNPVLSKVIQDIRELDMVYFDAIDDGILTAQEGYSLSGDVIHICDMLLDSGTSEEELRQFIVDMKDMANIAWKKCSISLNKFRDVRKGIIDLIKRVPEEVYKVNKTKLFIRPPLIEDAKEHDQELADAMERLKLTTIELEAFSESNSQFLKWWVEMEVNIKDAEVKGSVFRPGRDKGRVKQVRKIWSDIKQDYLDYKVKIIGLQDHYSSQMQRTPGFQSLHPNADNQSLPEPLPLLPVALSHDVLDTIVESAYKGLEILEPWLQASSDHPTLSKAIQEIRDLAMVYFGAINASIETADDAFGFSGDAVQLCELLFDPEMNEEDLHDYIQDMKDKAQVAWERCTLTLQKFRDVLKGLNEITKRVPEEVLEEDKTKLLIRAPLFGDESKRERDTELVEAMDKLRLAIVSLQILSKGVSEFAQWWVEIVNSVCLAM